VKRSFPSGLRFPPEQPGDDGAEELADSGQVAGSIDWRRADE
jgi:hypothetical protein